LKTQNINVAPGAQETAWEQAMSDYSSLASGHWRKAYQELSSLASTYPAFQGLLPYLNYAQGQAAHEQNAPSSLGNGAMGVILVIGLIVLLLVALAGVIFLLLRRGTRAAVVAPGYPAGMYQPAAGFPPVAASGAGGLYHQPAGGNTGAQPQIPGTPLPASLAAAYPYYTSPAAYGQVPQTPQPLPEHQPWSAPSDPGAQANFSLPPVQTPQPGAEEPASPVASAAEQFVSEQLPSSDAWPAISSLPAADVPTAQEAQAAVDADEQTVLTSAPDQEENATPAVEGAESSDEEATATPTSVSDVFTWLAPCGHANAPDVRFCRVCGRPVASAAPVAGSAESQS
jgi:hypothetical protein